jgi:hypothetical protein
VIVAGWRRPAFLLRTLAQLMEAAGADQHYYLVLLDFHASPTVEEVAAALPLPHLLLRMPPHFYMKSGWGNSYAVMEGFRYARSLAHQYKSELVYLVEEDVFVAADFFQFHRAVHEGREHIFAEGTPQDNETVKRCALLPASTFCVHTLASGLARPKFFAVMAYNKDILGEGKGMIGDSATERLAPCQRYSDAVMAQVASPSLPAQFSVEDRRDAQMVYAKPYYSSIGVSFDMVTLNKIVELALPRYYDDPAAFITWRFGSNDSFMERTYGDGKIQIEQDGLISRLVVEEMAVSVTPRCPRAFHAGFIGYNRESSSKNDLVGTTLVSRYEELASLTPVEMAVRTSVPDVIATPLEGYFTPTLRLCNKFVDGGTQQMHQSMQCAEFSDGEQ